MGLDFLIELLAEIFLEGAAEAAGHPKIPLWVRIVIVTVLSFLLIAVCGLVTLSCYKSGNFTGTIICGVVTAGLTALWIFGCVKISNPPKK